MWLRTLDIRNAQYKGHHAQNSHHFELFSVVHHITFARFYRFPQAQVMLVHSFLLFFLIFVFLLAFSLKLDLV